MVLVADSGSGIDEIILNDDGGDELPKIRNVSIGRDPETGSQLLLLYTDQPLEIEHLLKDVNMKHNGVERFCVTNDCVIIAPHAYRYTSTVFNKQGLTTFKNGPLDGLLTSMANAEFDIVIDDEVRRESFQEKVTKSKNVPMEVCW